MDTTTVAHPRTPDTRELRALRLFERRGHQIERLAPDVFCVPSQDGGRSYTVVYGELEESCNCPDYRNRGLNCVHIYAVGISLAKRRRPCGCVSGVAYVGHMLEDPDTGEEVEVYEPVPCRRCR